MKKAIVTGATGYIGFKLTEKLVSKGWNVGVVVRDSSDTSSLSKILDDENIFILENNLHNIPDILKEFAPDVIYHLAALVKNDDTDIDEVIDSNIKFGAKLLQSSVEADVKRFINTGTYWQNYLNKDYSPVNLYAASKEAFEKILIYYVEAYKLNAITLKLFDVYGPDDCRKKLINLLFDSLKTDEELNLSNGEQKKDFIFIDDVTDAFINAYEILPQFTNEYKVFGVATGKTITLRDLVVILEKISGKKIKLKFGVIPYRKREMMEPWSNYEKLPNWEPNFSVEDGLKLCYSTGVFNNNRDMK